MGLKAVSIDFRSFLLGQAAVTDVIGEEIYPFMAMEGKSFPIATYRVQQTPLSQSGDSYDIALFCWFQTYDECTEFTDTLTDIFKSSNAYEWKLSDLDYDPELKLFNGIINITTIT